MAMEWASQYVYDYQGESEEEEISHKTLEEGMWVSDDEDDDPTPVASAIYTGASGRHNSSRTNSGFWGSLLKRVTSRRKTGRRRKSKIKAPPQPKESDSDSSEEEVKSKEKDPPKKEPPKGDGYVELEFAEPVPPSNASLIASPPSPTRFKKQRRQRVKNDKTGGGIKTRRADTNILAVKFNTLSEAGHIHTGDAQFCSNTECGAVVSHLTKLIGEDDDDKKIWNCEFCGTATELDIVPEEIPTEEDTTYLITPAAVMSATDGGGGTVGMDESLVVFCIDTSGSMCVTTEVPGHYDLRGARNKEDKLLRSLPTNIAADLRQPEFRMRHMTAHNTTWISRMESLQAAVDTQLSRLVHSEPNKRVSIVTFSDDISVIGDGRMIPVTIAGVKLSDSKSIIDAGKDIPLPAPIRETQKALSKKIFSLEENGQTALGPAALTSVVIASQKTGSRVVLCTDGLANVGLGSLDVAASDRAAYAQAENFYEDLGDIAMDKGVTVSLLSIKGSDCRVVELGQIATRTGGQVTIVDPLTVTEEFGSILNNPILATDVVTKIIVHKEMYFRTEDSKENVIVKQVGNVTADSELTFEYGIRKVTPKPVKKVSADSKIDEDGEEEVKSKSQATPLSSPPPSSPPLIVNGQPHLAFQLQIEYTNSDGDRCLRVITQTKPVTKDRLVAEKAMDAAVISSHVGKKAAELTMQGEFTQARVSSLANQRLLQEHSRSSATRRRDYRTYCDNLLPLENQLHDLQLTEVSYGHHYSDDEGDEYLRGSDLMCTSYARPKMKSSSIGAPLKVSTASSRSAKESSRRQEMSDDMAFDVYKLYNSSSTSYRD